MKRIKRGKSLKRISISVFILAACAWVQPCDGSNGKYYTYDPIDRITSVSRDTTYTYTYVDNQNMVRHADERGNISSYYYSSYGDPDERLLKKVDNPGKGYTTYTYSAAGKLKDVTVQETNGPTTTRAFRYDTRQFLVSEKHPEMDLISGSTAGIIYTYDSAGNVKTRRDARGTVSYAYDAVDRVTSISYPDDTPDVAFTYYKDGCVKAMSSNVATFTYSYGPDHKLAGKSYTIDGQGYSVGFQYNELRNLSRVIYPSQSSRQVTYGYYPDRVRVQYVRDELLGRNLVTSVEYDPTGQISSITDGNGVTTSTTFDTNCRPRTISAPGIVGLQYDYDGCDNILSITDSVNPANTVTMGRSGYDSLNRLISSAGPWGALSYTYYYNGNRKTMSTGPSYTETYNYSSTTNRLGSITGGSTRTFAHDASGNMTSNGIFTFTYNLANRMSVSSDGFSYFYDGNGNRIKKAKGADTRIYHHGTGTNVICETTSSGGKLVDYIFLNDRIIAKYTW